MNNEGNRSFSEVKGMNIDIHMSNVYSTLLRGRSTHKYTIVKAIGSMHQSLMQSMIKYNNTFAVNYTDRRKDFSDVK